MIFFPLAGVQIVSIELHWPFVFAANANDLSTGEIFLINQNADTSHLDAASACAATEAGAGLPSIGTPADFELLDSFMDLNCVENKAIPIGNNILYNLMLCFGSKLQNVDLNETLLCWCVQASFCRTPSQRHICQLSLASYLLWPHTTVGTRAPKPHFFKWYPCLLIHSEVGTWRQRFDWHGIMQRPAG